MLPCLFRLPPESVTQAKVPPLFTMSDAWGARQVGGVSSGVGTLLVFKNERRWVCSALILGVVKLVVVVIAVVSWGS